MRPKIRDRLVSLVAAGMICVPPTAASQTRPVNPHVDYRGIAFSRLMAIYKQAYEDAGLRFEAKPPRADANRENWFFTLRFRN